MTHVCATDPRSSATVDLCNPSYAMQSQRIPTELLRANSQKVQKACEEDVSEKMGLSGRKITRKIARDKHRSKYVVGV